MRRGEVEVEVEVRLRSGEAKPVMKSPKGLVDNI
jgi:hypothetical protein